MRNPVDLARLEAFCDGTSEGLRAVIEIFLSDTSDTLTELNAAMARGEVSAVRLLAHRAGGSCAACGASALARILERLESTADVRGVVDESIAASQITASHRCCRKHPVLPNRLWRRSVHRWPQPHDRGNDSHG